MIVDAISDLHGYYPTLKGGDLLIVAGDLTARDDPFEYGQFSAWLDRQKYLKKILIAGNHDNYFQKKGYDSIRDVYADPDLYSDIGVEYLCDSGTEFTYYPLLEPGPEKEYERKTLKIWGSPWTKTFPGMNPNCKAFTCETEEELEEKWALIPEDTDILVTHSPPYGIFDAVRRYPQDIPESCGSKSLSEWMKNKWKVLDGIKINVFGHIHEHGGKTGSLNMIQFINASHVNERYQPVNKPIRIIL